MLNPSVLLMILGMAAVTYLPRALPAIWMERLHFGPRFEKFLNLIPYTAMAALIFPGEASSVPNSPVSCSRVVSPQRSPVRNPAK